METRVSITESEVREALAALGAQLSAKYGGEDGSTSEEYAESRGIHRLAARKELGRMVREGTVEVVKVCRPRIDQVMTLVSGYRLK